MREMSVREANQNFSQVIAAAERGETIVITKNGIPVARISPQARDRAHDPHTGVLLARPAARNGAGGIQFDDYPASPDLCVWTGRRQ